MHMVTVLQVDYVIDRIMSKWLNPMLVLNEFEEIILICFPAICLFNYYHWLLNQVNFLWLFPPAASSVSRNEIQGKNEDKSTFSFSWKSGPLFTILSDLVSKTALKTRKHKGKKHLFERVWKKRMSFMEILINSLIWISFLMG